MATSAQARSYDEPLVGGGWVAFAGTMLILVGFFNVIDGIAAIAQSHVFTANAHYVIGDLRVWGWVALILGALQLVAMLGVMVGNQVARWFGVAVIGLNLAAIPVKNMAPTSAGETSDDVRATWRPTHARRSAGSSSFQAQTFHVSGASQSMSECPVIASHSEGSTKSPFGYSRATPTSSIHAAACSRVRSRIAP